jgi:hypothetical protein
VNSYAVKLWTTETIVNLMMISLGCLLAAWAALLLTNAVTSGERKALLGVLLPQHIWTAHVASISAI